MLKFLTAFRYSFSGKSGQKSNSVLIMLSILVSVFSLILIISVLNGLQSSQTDMLRNVESFDLIVRDSVLTAEDLKQITQEDVYQFSDIPAVIKTSSGSESIRIRAIDIKYFDHPRTLDCVFLNGIPEKGLCPSFTILNKLMMKPGEKIDVTIIKKGKTATLVPYSFSINASNVYSSALVEFSQSTAFMDIEELKEFTDDVYPEFGVFSERKTSEIERIILKADPSATVITWQEYNNAVYSALLLEKILVYIFLAFIFLIICVSLRNSTKRLIKVKSYDSTILRAVGFTESDLHCLYFYQSLMITIPGSLTGSILGVLFVGKIDSVLYHLGNLISRITGHVSILSMLPFSASISSVEVFSIVSGVILLALIFTLSALKEFRRNSILEVLSNVGN